MISHSAQYPALSGAHTELRCSTAATMVGRPRNGGMLRHIRDSLKPGGRLIVDVAEEMTRAGGSYSMAVGRRGE